MCPQTWAIHGYLRRSGARAHAHRGHRVRAPMSIRPRIRPRRSARLVGLVGRLGLLLGLLARRLLNRADQLTLGEDVAIDRRQEVFLGCWTGNRGVQCVDMEEVVM